MWSSDIELLAALGQKHWDKVFNRPCFSRRVEEGGEEVTRVAELSWQRYACLDACFHLTSEAHMELGCLTHVPELLSRDLFQKVVSR